MLHSFSTLIWLVMYSLAMPLADDDDDDDGCGSEPVEDIAVSTTVAVHVTDSPSAGILAPYEHPPTPHPSPSQHPHATLPVSHRSQTPVILGTVVGIMIALAAVFFTARYVGRRRRIAADPFKDPPKPRFTAFRLRRPTASKKRLSDESWVSPILPALGSPGSPLLQDHELRRYACPRRRLIPVTTPVCTPTDTEFGSRLEFANSDPDPVVPIPPVRVPSPVYIPPFSPSPSLSSSSSSLSPAPSAEPLSSPSPDAARLSRLLSSTFRGSRVVLSPARPTTAHLIHTARSYAHAYRPSSATTTSLYTQPSSSVRLAGTRSRTSFYPGPTDDARAAWGRVRDTFSTVTTSDTDTVCTVPHLLRAVAEVQPPTSPFADPDPDSGNEQQTDASSSRNTEGQTRAQTPAGTSLGLKLRLSDASEHARYRLRERERERERQRERERAEQRLSTDSQASDATVRAVHDSLDVEEVSVGKEFKLRDSESVLRVIGW